MPDRRRVYKVPTKDLERIVAVRKREARQARVDRMRAAGRVIETDAPPPLLAEGEPRTAKIAPAKYDAKLNPGIVDMTPRPKRRRRIFNFLLLLVEIVAVVAIVILGISLVGSITQLQEESAEAQALAEEQRRNSLPTLEPTPQLALAQVILPSGHTPPTEIGGGQFNFEEIPQHLQPLIRDQVFLPPEIKRPPPTDETPTRLVIPKINVDQTIVQGVDWEALKLGIGQVQNGVMPNQSGNVVLAGHNDIYGEVFRYLDQLEEGDQFELHTESSIYTYEVTGFEIVAPTAIHVMEDRGNASATLISCYPYHVDTERIIIYADQISA